METSLVFLGQNEWENGLTIVTASLSNSDKYKINGRFVTNLEPQFKIKHDRVKEPKNIYTIEKKIEKRFKSKCKDVYSSGCH